MKVRGLILVLLWPWLAEAAQQHYGTRAAAIELEGALSGTDLQQIPLRAGELITPENVRASIQALYDTGRYAYIEVDATPADTGTRLTFRVRPHYFFSTFQLEPDDLLERPISGHTRVPIGEKFSRSTVDRIAAEVDRLLEAQGYFEATINPEYHLDDGTRLATVTLKADKGPRAKVGKIQLTGGEQTFSTREMLDSFDVDPGDDFSSEEVDEGIAKIRKEFLDLGFLNTRVTIDQQYFPASRTVELNLQVEPGQFTLVEIRGHDISEDDLQDLLPIYEEGTVDEDLVEEGRIQLVQYLNVRGYFDVTVSKEIIQAPLDNAIQINYTVETGERHSIDSVSIEGNQHFSDEDILERIQIRKAGLFDKGVFSSEILAEDVRTVQAMYRSAGFDGTTVQGSFEVRDHSVDVIVQIEEGRQWPVDLITFLGNFDLQESELFGAIGMKAGDTYTLANLNTARNALTGFYHSRGYADVRVEADAERIQSNHGMHVRFTITEGEPYVIGTIAVAGNERTKEKIVHRYSNLFPGTPYNPEAILEAQQRLYASGLFSRVEIVALDETSSRLRNLLIQVEDSSPILLMYGVGVQELASDELLLPERGRTFGQYALRGTVEVSHNNLFGLNRSISVRVRGSRLEQMLRSTYREPRLFNRDIDGFATLLLEHVDRPAVEYNRFDFSFQALKRFPQQRNVLLLASYQTVNLRDIRVNPRAEEFPLLQGVIQIARIGASFIQDRRDDAINPTSGSFSTTSLQVANKLLGSEVNFTSVYNQTNHYFVWGPGVVANSVRLGWNQPYGGTESLVITERYFAGGSTTLRGFDLDEALPEGGEVMTIADIEYRVPLRRLPIRGIDGAVFYDTGNVFPTVGDIQFKDFTHTLGFGVRYHTPIGPVRFDVGFNMKPRIRFDGTREERVQVFFTLGNPF